MNWTRRAMILTAATGLVVVSAQYAARQYDSPRESADSKGCAATPYVVAAADIDPPCDVAAIDVARQVRARDVVTTDVVTTTESRSVVPASAQIAPEAFVGMLSPQGMQLLAMAEPGADAAPVVAANDDATTKPADGRGPGRRWRDRDRDGPPPRPDGGFEPPGGPGGPGMGGFGGPGMGGPGGPGGPGGFRRGPGGMGGPGGMRPAFPGAGLPPIDNSDPSDDEWERIANFWRENSPARWAQYEQLEVDASAPDAPAMLDRYYTVARRRMAMRHRMIEQLREHKQEKLADLSVDSLRAEDSAFDAFQKMRSASSDAVEAARKSFRESVGKFVDASFAEREERTDMLRQVLKREEERLKKDRDGRDEIIRRQSERFEREFGMMTGQRSDGPATKPADDR